MDEVWCGLDLQLQANDIAGLHRAGNLHDHDHDPFWPALADCAVSFLEGDSACFGVADVDLTGSAATKVDGMVGMDTSALFLEQDDHLMQQQEQHDPTQYSSSSLSSKRSLSIDSGGSSPFFALDPAALAFSSHPAAPAPQDPLSDDDAAIMRAMMAVLSSASPSSSESSSPPLFPDRDTTTVQAAVQPRGDNDGHLMVKSTSLAVAQETTTSLTSGGRQQQDEVRTAAGSNGNQVYHMMSERKRREKLNDSFQMLRSVLPPCSKKDKTTVLINAASYLKTLEAQVSELEEKNTKLERHVPREDGGSSASMAAHRRAKVQISKAPSDDQVNLTVMVMVECDIVDLVLHVLECLRWMSGISVMSVDADTYSPQVLLKAIASIKLQITDGDCWNEASFHEAMTKAVHDATSSLSSAAPAPLVVAA
ncbi:putative transcription factor bHLH041 [Phragmites australis]|uniref:putative transcription factor bHLH041 n=1 Tax=Phragmites australis TaxID=29695 RepID=UPI002D766DDE|nr:putative transcription factor bHLH041 [Phragmites australis]